VRGVRALRGGLPGGRDLPRGGRERRHGAGRPPRYAKVYQIHKTRCIFCGYCEEACPVSAIFMGKDYELAVYSNKDFIWDKEDLLVPGGPVTGPVVTTPVAR
jgi:formate hydrogenlyase subunit 6/NADH:ubiquinone oxidoreductase subunit I